jgi:hypothetical protein
MITVRKLRNTEEILILRQEALFGREVSKDFDKRRLGVLSFWVFKVDINVALKTEAL